MAESYGTKHGHKRPASGATRRIQQIITLIVIAVAIAAVVPTIRHGLLRTAGWALVIHDKPLRSADVIVVAIDAGSAGVLEAAELVHAGVSARVAIFPDPGDDVMEREFIRRGVPYENAAATSARQLRSFGVGTIDVIPRVAGSEEEGEVLPAWCDKHGFRAVVVVTTPDHSRRMGRILRRSKKRGQTFVTVLARYSFFDPDQWWTTRGGIRIEFVEVEKLLLDVGRHPFP